MNRLGSSFFWWGIVAMVLANLISQWITNKISETAKGTL